MYELVPLRPTVDGYHDVSGYMCGGVVPVNMTIALPPHRVARLKEIVHAIPHTHRRVGIDKCHKTLGELRSMALALPGAQGLFSQMQEALLSRQRQEGHPVPRRPRRLG